MKCRKCGKNVPQVWGRWSPEDPDVTRRGYLCRTCRIGYVEIFSRISQNVIRIEETDFNVKKEIQTTLGDYSK